MRRKEILIISPDFPYPPNHGGRLDVWNRILELHENGVIVDLIATVKKPPLHFEVDIVNKYVRSITILKRNLTFLYPLKLRPFQIESRRSLIDVDLNRTYDIAILESEAVSLILRKIPDKTKTILRIHNDEVRYFQSLCKSEKNPIRKMFYFTESILYKLSVPKIRDSVNYSFHISTEEFDRDLYSREKYYYPPVVSFDSSVSSNINLTAANSPTVLFVGNLFTANNLAAIQWYITQVHPKVRRELPHYKMVIAGNTGGRSIKEIFPNEIESIEFIESPKVLEDIYKRATLFINPMLSGAGVKLKTIQAIIHGLPIVTTTVGCEGTGLLDGRHVCIRDDAEGFSSAIIWLARNPEILNSMNASATNFVKHAFDHDKILKQFF